ncbi:MAG: archease [Candidatus Aenigmarchaeota archaeon]|nr:archease [Candidatus Aenigmarchaeota archaeon]
MKYRFISDLTSDVMFEALGKTEGELLENSAEAIFAVQAKIDQIRPLKTLEFDFFGEDLRQTLFHFLNRLLAEAEIAELFLCQFKVELEKLPEGYRGHLTAKGEPITPEKGGTVVKAVTLYNFKVEETEGGFRATVVCDI